MIKLYQFPISHYSEKARWALAYKGLPYQKVNLLPGLHSKTTTRLAKRSSVPILQHEQNIIQNSSDIIDYLDQHFSERPLTPVDPAARAQALEWESYVDKELGPHVRRLCYFTLLDHPRLCISLLGHQGPWYGKLFLRLIFPKLRKLMYHYLKISPESVAESEQQVRQALAKLNQAWRHSGYLVGDQFSRADLAAAALLAPLCAPSQYGIPWPKHYPQPLDSLCQQLSPQLQRVRELYRLHRPDS
ncbi:glutathione S-transferase family protein [Balneatrix alpica]|uniref:glutathione S-transferase family protein n=1 Tax=Balneatrix alpica TaxID=75684 RepID=UPI002739AE12|nr:glutathione S-transferase family protein [Balneatrix alpica]